MEEIDPKKLIFRRLSYLDFLEFKKAAIESVPTNEAYLAFGHIFKNISVLEYMYEFSQLIKDGENESYGLFHRNTFLGFVGFQFGLSQLGTELIGWTRNGYQKQGLGELGLNTACHVAFEGKGFNYVELRIDSENKASRAVAEKAGFIPLLRMKYFAGDDSTFIYYVKINPKVEALAQRYRRRTVDIINSPASIAPHHYFLKSESVSEFYNWPFEEFNESAKPVNMNLLSSYLALINLHPDDLGV
jgi:RimJ/RimL family protein N-acetyltransferase